jgi:RNA recognition motif-containing protein
LFVKNLRFVELHRDIAWRREIGWSVWLLTRNSYNVTPEELFDLFGKFGPIRYAPQIIRFYMEEEN